MLSYPRRGQWIPGVVVCPVDFPSNSFAGSYRKRFSKLRTFLFPQQYSAPSTVKQPTLSAIAFAEVVINIRKLVTQGLSAADSFSLSAMNYCSPEGIGTRYSSRVHFLYSAPTRVSGCECL
jgi:hypothetical protein